MKKILFLFIIGILVTSCSLDRAPKDSLSTATFPKTEKDIEMLVVGCYDGYVDQTFTMMCLVIMAIVPSIRTGLLMPTEKLRIQIQESDGLIIL